MADRDIEDIAAAAGIAIVQDVNIALDKSVNNIPDKSNMCKEEKELDALFASRYTADDPEFSEDIIKHLREVVKTPPMIKDLHFRPPRNNNWRGKESRGGWGDRGRGFNRGGWAGNRGGKGEHFNEKMDNRGDYGGNYGRQGHNQNRDSRQYNRRDRSPHR